MTVGAIIGICIAALVIVFLLVLLLRAASFRPRDMKRPALAPVTVDGERAVRHLAEMVRCKTVSSRTPELRSPESEFEKFREQLKEQYPLVHKTCELTFIEPSGLLYKLPGKSCDKPTVLMSHYDVVAATEEMWQKPAFEGIIEDGILWGRGTLDNKITLAGIMESAESLLADGFVPEHDVYFSFSGDEEIAGDSAPNIVTELERRGVAPILVVDEGGAVVSDIFPGVKERCALIGTAEKGMMDVRFVAKSRGGHASAPPPHTIVGELAQACVNVEGHPFKTEMSLPVSQMFDTLGRHSTFVYRLIFSNLWLFSGVLDSMCRRKGGEMNAMMRTTVAFTQMKGSEGTNVLPPEASMVANMRLNGSTTTDSAIAYLNKAIANEHIEVQMMYGMNPSPCTSSESEGFRRVANAVVSAWPGVLVSPYLMVQCSDSRHFSRICRDVLKYSAMELSAAERACIHGNDERIPLEKVAKCVEYYTYLMQQC